MHKKKFKTATTSQKIDVSVFNLASEKKLKTRRSVLSHVFGRAQFTFYVIRSSKQVAAINTHRKIRIWQKKTTDLCLTVMAPEQMSIPSRDLSNTLFSLIVDETTDVLKH